MVHSLTARTITSFSPTFTHCQRCNWPSYDISLLPFGFKLHFTTLAVHNFFTKYSFHQWHYPPFQSSTELPFLGYSFSISSALPFQACAVQCEARLQQSFSCSHLLKSSVTRPHQHPPHLHQYLKLEGAFLTNAGPFTSTLKLQKYFHHIRQGGSSWTSGPRRCILNQRRSFYEHFEAAEIFSPHRTGGQQLVIKTREMHDVLRGRSNTQRKKYGSQCCTVNQNIHLDWSVLLIQHYHARVGGLDEILHG